MIFVWTLTIIVGLFMLSYAWSTILAVQKYLKIVKEHAMTEQARQKLFNPVANMIMGTFVCILIFAACLTWLI